MASLLVKLCLSVVGCLYLEYIYFIFVFVFDGVFYVFSLDVMFA